MTYRLPLLLTATMLLAATPALAEDTSKPGLQVALAGKERTLDTPFGPILLLSSGGPLGMFSTSEPPGTVRPPLSHSNEDEAFYVLGGTYRFTVNHQTIDATPGTTIVIPRNDISAYENVGKTRGRLLVTESPGGFVQFFVDVAEKKLTAMDQIVALEKTYGIVPVN